jgi:outer membrane protein assembly factor BamE (lipoprotein component of BamABCDE complex)
MQIKSVSKYFSQFSACNSATRLRKISLTTILATTFFAALAFTGNASAEGSDIESLVNQPGVYTLTNLHPDEARSKLYSVNFQQAGLIPLCTEVEITRVSRKRIKFTVKESGRSYKYDNHRHAGESLKTNAAKYFGTECNKAKVAKLSKKDQEGIKQGKALVGMSKQGVIYAIGYPPVTRTPTLDANAWIYWFNRFNTFEVKFNSKGVVSDVIN